MAGKTLPKPKGSVDGAPVLGYVFPTTLKPEDAGFGKVEGFWHWQSRLIQTSMTRHCGMRTTTRTMPMMALFS